jgi:hypothetical protein
MANTTSSEQDEDRSSLPADDVPEFLRGHEEAPKTPAETLERIPTMSEEEAKKLDEKRGLSADDLSKIEESAGHENTVGAGYKPGAGEHHNSWRSKITKKRAALGGGAGLAAILGLFFFFTFTGPLQFIHFAQILQQFHFSTSEDQGDNRSFRMYRFIKSGGDVKEARVGVIGSKLANKMDAKFRAAGFEPIGNGGTYQGFEIDRQNSKFKARTTADIRSELASQGINTAVEANGRITVSAESRYGSNISNVNGMMKRVGYSKLASAIQTRAVAGKWFGFGRFHPMRAADNRINQKLADYWESFKKKFNQRVGKGSYGVTGSAFGEKRTLINCDPPNECSDEDIRYNEEAQAYNDEIDRQAAEAAKAAQELDGEGKAVNNEDQRERGDKTRELARRLGGRLTKATGIGALSSTAVLCTVDGMNDKYEELKQDRIILPLIRLSLEFVAVGNQVMNGQDVDLDQLSAYNQYFDDPATGSWENAPSIKAEMGQKTTRELTDDQKLQKDNLDTIGKSSPLQGIVDAANGFMPPGLSVKKVCSTTGQVVSTIFTVGLSILTGGGFSIASMFTSAVFSSVATEVAMNIFASLFAGTAVDPFAQGALFGTNADYGLKLAASGFNMSKGGNELSGGESQELQEITRANIDRQFQNKSLAYKLFNPYDPKTAMSKLFDAPDPQLSGNFAKITGSMFNIGQIFSSMPSVFSPSAGALTPLPYDYGFPDYGFSAGEMNNSAVENPYSNARAAVQLLKDDPELLERASNCFGVSIAPDASGALGVTHTGEAPNPYNKSNDSYSKWDCNDSSTEWLRIRFFIFDTTTADALDCYINDDTTSCANVGFTPPPAAGGGISCEGGVPDQSAGTPPDEYRDAIIAQAGGRSCPDFQADTKGTPVPDDGRQYYAYDGCKDNCDQYRRDDGSCYIRVQYRDPPLGGNTVEVTVACK